MFKLTFPNPLYLSPSGLVYKPPCYQYGPTVLDFMLREWSPIFMHQQFTQLPLNSLSQNMQEVPVLISGNEGFMRRLFSCTLNHVFSSTY